MTLLQNVYSVFQNQVNIFGSLHTSQTISYKDIENITHIFIYKEIM